MKKILIIMLMVAAISSTTHAATGGWQDWDRGNGPQLIFTTNDYIEVVFASITTAPATPTGCAANNFVHFDVAINTPEYKKLLAMLLLAKATGGIIGFNGGICNIGNGAMGTNGTDVFIDE